MWYDKDHFANEETLEMGPDLTDLKLRIGRGDVIYAAKPQERRNVQEKPHKGRYDEINRETCLGCKKKVCRGRCEKIILH